MQPIISGFQRSLQKLQCYSFIALFNKVLIILKFGGYKKSFNLCKLWSVWQIGLNYTQVHVHFLNHKYTMTCTYSIPFPIVCAYKLSYANLNHVVYRDNDIYGDNTLKHLRLENMLQKGTHACRKFLITC